MVHREIKYVPGFFKIVDEILVNAADNKVSCLLCAYALHGVLFRVALLDCGQHEDMCSKACSISSPPAGLWSRHAQTTTGRATLLASGLYAYTTVVEPSAKLVVSAVFFPHLWLIVTGSMLDKGRS